MNQAAMINELKQDETFLKSIAEAETAEEMAALFTKKGFETSANDIENILGSAINEKGELNETQLESVSGGVAWWVVPAILIAIGIYGKMKYRK